MGRFLKQLNNFLKDTGKKNYFKISKEVAVLWASTSKFPLHYFTRFVYRKDAGFYKDYIEIPLAKKIWSSNSLHDKACCNLLRDKEAFAKFALSRQIATPVNLCTSDGFFFTFNDKTYEINTFEEFKQLICETIGKDIFIKPTDGIQGKNCFKVKTDVTDEYLARVFEVVKKGRFLYQGLIMQHPLISAINPFSTNTIRVDTYKDNDGNVHILTPFLRLGRGENITDNTSNNGFIIAVDLENEVLNDYGIQYLKSGISKIYEHPDTHVKFKNYAVPYAKEIKLLVKKIATEVSDKLVGWDVAISVDGPVIVEGNCDYAMAGQDIITKGYKRHPIFRKMLVEHGFIKA